jgi:hypothetical protein
MKTVRAFKVGFYGSLRIPGQPGEVFEVEDDDYGSWFEEVESGSEEAVDTPIPKNKKRRKSAQNEGGSAIIDGDD